MKFGAKVLIIFVPGISGYIVCNWRDITRVRLQKFIMKKLFAME